MLNIWACVQKEWKLVEFLLSFINLEGVPFMQNSAKLCSIHKACVNDGVKYNYLTYVSSKTGKDFIHCHLSYVHKTFSSSTDSMKVFNYNQSFITLKVCGFRLELLTTLCSILPRNELILMFNIYRILSRRYNKTMHTNRVQYFLFRLIELWGSKVNNLRTRMYWN